MATAQMVDDFAASMLAKSVTRGGLGRPIRLAADQSQGDVADAAGLSRGQLSQYERGISTPTGDRAVRYGRVLAALIDLTSFELDEESQ